MATWAEAVAITSASTTDQERRRNILEQYGEVAAKIFDHTDPTGFAVGEHGRDWREDWAHWGHCPGPTLRDPLGRGTLDFSTGKLQSGTTVGCHERVPDSELRSGDVVDPRSKEFDPELFLLQFHHDIEGPQLFEEGRAALEKERIFHTGATSELVKSHFDKLILVDDAVESFRSIIIGTKSENLLLKNTAASTSNATELERAFQETESLTSQLYGPLLDRQVDTERIQRVLATMQKFRYVYDLPAKLREAIVIGHSGGVGLSEQGISSSNLNDQSFLDREGSRAIPMVEGSVQAMASGIVAGYKKTKKWIEAQPESPALRRIVAEINMASIDFRSSIYRQMEDPMMSPEALAQSLRVLGTLDPTEDHGMRILTRRQEKALEGLRRVRGAGAADFILRRRLGGVSADRHEYAEMVLSAETLTVKLCNAASDGIALFWRLAKVIIAGSSEWQDMKSANGVHLLISEIVGEYAEGVRITVLPQQLTGAGLVSRHAAMAVIGVMRYAEGLGIPANHLGSLRSITEEVSESFIMNAVRSMRNVAQELGSDQQTDTKTLAEQVLLLVRETLCSVEGVFQRGSSVADTARNACVKVTVIAATAMRRCVLGEAEDEESIGLVCRTPGPVGCIDVNADSLSAEESNRVLVMAAICSELREKAVPAIGQSVSEMFGGGDLARVMVSASLAIHRMERSATELYVHYLVMPLVSRVIRGVVCGGSMNPGSLLTEPRSYATALVTEVAMISSVCQGAVGMGNSTARHAVDLIVGSVGAAFRGGIRELEGIPGRLGEQLLLEAEFMDGVLSGGRRSGGSSGGGTRRKSEKMSAFATAKRLLRADVVKKQDEVRFSELLTGALERAQFLCGAFATDEG